jgi:ribosomal protein S5
MKVNVYSDEVANIKQIKLVRKTKPEGQYTGVQIATIVGDQLGGVVFWTKTKAQRKRLADILETAAKEIRNA